MSHRAIAEQDTIAVIAAIEVDRGRRIADAAPAHPAEAAVEAAVEAIAAAGGREV